MQKTGKYYWLTVISFILQIFSILGILVCSALGTNYWGLLICLIVTSFGAGLAITATLINVIANSDPADQAVACEIDKVRKVFADALAQNVAQATRPDNITDYASHDDAEHHLAHAHDR